MSLEFFKKAIDAVEDINETDLKKLIIDECFWISLNANDTFGYACADATNVDLHDLPKLIEMRNKFGDFGVLAFQAKLRDMDPIPPLVTDKYKEAKNYLKDWKPFEDAAREVIELKYKED